MLRLHVKAGYSVEWTGWVNRGHTAAYQTGQEKINKIYRSETKEWDIKRVVRVDGWLAGDIGLLAALAKAMLL